MYTFLSLIINRNDNNYLYFYKYKYMHVDLLYEEFEDTKVAI